MILRANYLFIGTIASLLFFACQEHKPQYPISSVTDSIPLAGKNQPDRLFDSLNVDAFDIIATGAAPSAVNTILLDEAAFLKKFGRPTHSAKEYAEMDEQNMMHYTYGEDADVWYMNDSLQAISLKSPKYCLRLSDGGTIKVGDDIKTVAGRFPGAWSGRQVKDQVFVSLYHQLDRVDTNLLFEFDSTTNRIKLISVND